MSNPGESAAPQRGRRKKQYQWGNRWAAKSLKWVAIPVVVIFFVGLIGFFTARPAYRAFKLKNAERRARTAEAQFNDGEYQDSFKNIATALLLAPGSFPVNLSAAKIYSKASPSMALNHWQLVMRDPRATRENLLSYIDTAFELERYDLVREELANRNVLEPLDDELLWRKLRLLSLSQRFDEAVDLARVAFAARPELTERELALGEALLRSSKPEWQAEGRRLLMGLALADMELQSVAAAALRRFTLLSAAESESIARSLERKRQPRLPDFLEGARLRVAARPEQVDQVVDTLLTEAAPEAFSDRIAIANWLVEINQAAKARDLISPAEAGTNVFALTLRIEALTARGDWQAVDAMMQGTNHVQSPALLEIVRATRSAAQGDSETTRGHLQLAIDKGLKEPALARMILALTARTAERVGLTTVAVDGYMRLMEYPDLLVPSVRQALRLLTDDPSLRQAFTVIQTLHRYAPGDPGVAFEHAYLSALFDEDLPEARKSLETIPSNHPNRGLLAAFLKSKGGQADTALAEFEAETADWRALPPRWQAVYVNLLGLAQQREAARTNARLVDRSQLKTEEAAMIERWL